MELAPRGKRLGAQLIDALILSAFLVLSMLDDVLPVSVLMLFAVAALALSIAQIVLLARRGQSIGKIVLGLRIVRKDTGENGGFVVNVLLRSGLNALLAMNPIYFFADSCLIFREDRRCIHDLIAGTVVVDASSEPHPPTAA